MSQALAELSIVPMRIPKTYYWPKLLFGHGSTNWTQPNKVTHSGKNLVSCETLLGKSHRSHKLGLLSGKDQHNRKKKPQTTTTIMISRSPLFLAAILFSSSTAVSSATGGGALRKALQVAQQELTCQLATLHTTYKSDEENQVSHGEQTTCTLVQDGVVPTPFAYPIVLPSDFLEQHENNIERGRLLVSIRGASLVAGEYVLEDDNSEIIVLDDNFSQSTSGRTLLETKDPRDAFGERRLIAFRVNGAEGEKQVRSIELLSLFALSQ
jgi:hypothetical protein